MHGFRLTVTLAVSLACGSAAAVDGVIEINQHAAEAGGVVPGDSPGFPVTIDQPGSYRLTGNLDLRGLASPENTTAIQVEAGDVAIDLNGFAILGANSCTGTPATCTLSGTGDGINSTASGLRVSNGTVRGMGRHGMRCRRCLIEQVSLEQNGGNGLEEPSGHGRAIDVHVEANGNDGLRGNSLLVVGSRVLRNGAYGINGGAHSVIRDNVITQNGGNGVRCVTCVLTGNVLSNNAGYGAEFQSSNGRSGYAQNVISSNTLGAVIGVAVQTGSNVCGFAVCP